MATVSKASKPRKGSLLTRNGRTRLNPLSLTQLVALKEKTSTKKGKAKINTRILVLERRTNKLQNK
jgi:hypothetical protein